MIYGVTHEEDGTAIKRATIGYKLSIGLPPQEGRNYPQRLDHFIVTVKTAKAGGWEEDVPFTKMLKDKYCPGEVPFRELDVILLDEDPEKIFRSEYAWRTQTQLKCHGDGRDAVRRFSELHPDDQRGMPDKKPNDWIEIDGCGRGCPQLEQKLCKPSGDLYFIFPERPVLGSVAMLHTSGYESVKRLTSSLQDIMTKVAEHGGTLKGLQLKLVARPYKTSWLDGAARKSSSQLGFNLEFRQEDHRKLLPALVQQSRDFNKDIGEVIDVETLSEEETQSTIQPEFHPTEEQIAEKNRAEAAIETKQEVQRASQRPKVLDKVAGQQPATAAAATPTPVAKVTEQKLTIVDLKAGLEAARTVEDLDRIFAQAKTVPKAEDALKSFYETRRGFLKPPATPAATAGNHPKDII